MKKYKIIYADPPWTYKLTGGKTNSRGMAKQHYKTMSLDNICKLPIRNICTNDSLLFIWATFPQIEQAITVINAWGFTYKTAAFVWVKQNKKANTPFWGMGAYTRANAEVCLLGISRDTKAKQIVKSNSVHQIIESPIQKHSKKPAIVRDKIIELVGPLPRLELFARDMVEGWDCWGDEVESNIKLGGE